VPIARNGPPAFRPQVSKASPGGPELLCWGEAACRGRPWLAPEAVRQVRKALQGVLDGLARRPPVGTLAAGRVVDALAVLPQEG
jgi:hypothetical protein